ncbi:VOC family protein [Micromonospora sp. NPDC051543]|uniref:VOC family protein n=1 Tax=Micromonospora sp. NPDC051543 TaxID=3364287 RepID=UPI0037A5BC80
MGNAALGSILLGTTDPVRLRAWYRAALAPDDTGAGFIDFGGIGILIDGRSDVDEKNPQPGRLILNFHVPDARALAAHLDEVGVTWVAELTERDAGLFGTFQDPDGNYLQIIQLSDAYLAEQTGRSVARTTHEEIR